jgi:hypothetical protein
MINCSNAEFINLVPYYLNSSIPKLQGCFFEGKLLEFYNNEEENAFISKRTWVLWLIDCTALKSGRRE